MSFTTEEIVPITQFWRNIWKYIKQINDKQKKLALIKNNKLEAVVLPVELYDYMLEKIEDKEIEEIVSKRNIEKSKFENEEEFLKDFLD